jgi:glycosyltransferase involved in cell wall biosynthesis
MSKPSKNNSHYHCMVVHAYYPHNESRVEREAMALVKRGLGVDVICLRATGEPAMDMTDGVHIYRLPVRRHRGSGLVLQLLEYLSFLILAFFKLIGLNARRRYSTVQVHNLPDFLVFAALGPKMSGAKIILDLHDLMPEFFAASSGHSMSSLPVRLLVWQEQLSCRFANHVITVTNSWRETLIKRGVSPTKVSVVMNLPDSRIFYRNNAAEVDAADENSFRLIYHGTLSYRYGVDLLLHSISSLQGQIPGIELMIHGQGEYLDELLELHKSLDLGDRVYFSTNYMPITDLPRMIQSANVGIVPYRRNIFTDGILPTKLMEYVALGVPVVAARTPIIEEYFNEDMLQFFIPEDVEDLANSILALHQDRDKLARLAKNANEFNQTYHWGSVAANYVSHVERLRTS